MSAAWWRSEQTEGPTIRFRIEEKRSIVRVQWHWPDNVIYIYRLLLFLHFDNGPLLQYFDSDLKDVQLLEIIDTFSVYRDILENIFQSNRHIPDRIIKPNFDWLLISHSLISSSQQTEMYRKIRSELVIENSISSSVRND